MVISKVIDHKSISTLVKQSIEMISIILDDIQDFDSKFWHCFMITANPGIGGHFRKFKISSKL